MHARVVSSQIQSGKMDEWLAIILASLSMPCPLSVPLHAKVCRRSSRRRGASMK